MKAFQIVTIEREYASGGTQVGRLLGKALGVPVYGREILEIAARESGTTPEYIEQLEETDTNSLLYSLVAMGKTSLGQLPEISRTDQLNVLEGEIIQRLAHQGPCVLVGRCAGWVLRERGDVLNVFIHASREERLRRAREDGCRGVRLMSGFERGAAHEFYEHNGYVHRKNQRNYEKDFF